MSKLIKVNDGLYEKIKELEGKTFNDKLNGILLVYHSKTNSTNGIPLVNQNLNGIPPVYLNNLKSDIAVILSTMAEILKYLNKAGNHTVTIEPSKPSKVTIPVTIPLNVHTGNV